MQASPLQAERWLAAEPVALTAGTKAAITLRASSDMWVDLRRLCIQIGSYKGSGTAGQNFPVFGDAGAATEVTSILVKDSIQLVRGISPTVAASYWSPLRPNTYLPLGASGSYLFMASGETVAIDLKTKNGIDAIATAAAPCYLAVDKGKPFLPAGYSPDQAQTALGSAVTSITVSSNKGSSSAHPLKFSEAGVLFLHDMQIVPYCDSQTTEDGGYAGQVLSAMAYIEQVRTTANNQLVVGNPDSSGNAVGVPALCYLRGSGFATPNSWCRLPAQPGTSGNSVEIDLTTYAGNGVSSAQLSVSAGFQASATGQATLGLAL